MQTIQQDPTIVLDGGRSGRVWAVAFYPDGMHILGGGGDKGIRRWRLADGREVGERVEMDVINTSVSRDHKWVVFGTTTDASARDAGLREKVIDVQGNNWVQAVDVSPDSTQ